MCSTEWNYILLLGSGMDGVEYMILWPSASADSNAVLMNSCMNNTSVQCGLCILF